MKILFICAIMASLILNGCATNHSVSTVSNPEVFKKSLEKSISSTFPLSDWGPQRSTLYDPQVEIDYPADAVWVRLKGLTWDKDENRHRFSVDMLMELEIDTSNNSVKMLPARELQWHFSDTPRAYRQEVIDMTYPIIIDTFYDRGFSNVEVRRPPSFPE